MVGGSLSAAARDVRADGGLSGLALAPFRVWAVPAHSFPSELPESGGRGWILGRPGNAMTVPDMLTLNRGTCPLEP